MWRNTMGSVLAVVAAAAAVVSVWFDWYGNRDGWRFKWPQLFTDTGITPDNANWFTGMFLPMLVGAALAVAAILLRSRLLMLLSAVVVLGFAILWLVRQYNVADSLTVGAGGLKWPALLPLGAGVLLLVSAASMAGRHVARHKRGGDWRRREEAAAGPQPAEGYPEEYPPVAGGTYPEEHPGARVHHGPWGRRHEPPPGEEPGGRRDAA
jgi:hypothetical protein